MNQKEHILQAIRKVRKDVVPANGKVVLFGSQAQSFCSGRRLVEMRMIIPIGTYLS